MSDARVSRIGRETAELFPTATCDEPGCICGEGHLMPHLTSTGTYYLSGSYQPLLPMIEIIHQAFVCPDFELPGSLLSLRICLAERLGRKWTPPSSVRLPHRLFDAAVQTLGYAAVAELDYILNRRRDDARARELGVKP